MLPTAYLDLAFKSLSYCTLQSAHGRSASAYYTCLDIMTLWFTHILLMIRHLIIISRSISSANQSIYDHHIYKPLMLSRLSRLWAQRSTDVAEMLETGHANCRAGDWPSVPLAKLRLASWAPWFATGCSSAARQAAAVRYLAGFSKNLPPLRTPQLVQ